MDNELIDTIKKLSQLEGFKDVYHEQGSNDSMPSTEVLKEIVQLARSILFPGYFGNSAVNSLTIMNHIGVNIDRLQILLAQQIKAGICFSKTSDLDDGNETEMVAVKKATDFILLLPVIREKLHTDVIAAYNGDPAAKSFGEVIFCYPSIRAISNYRIANALLKLDVPLIPRIITEMAHSETGIDIHPGATIG